MATVDEDTLRLGAVADLLDRYGIDPVHVVVFNAVIVALVTRLYDLGGRTAHWDEARVAYWIVEFMHSGNFEYRPIIHGPFYHHVNAVLFEVFGVSDFSMRLSVAVIGGLFPLVALLFRDRLRDLEVGALAVFLAINPALLYYSRFMRGDPLVAMFMFTSFALFVRAVDTGKTRYVHAGIVSTALGFTVKENALLYLAAWVGATALLLDHRLLLAGDRPRDPNTIFVAYVWRAGGLIRRYWLTGVVAIAEFVTVIVYFYAPRSQSEPGPGLWKAIEGGNLDMFLTVAEAATVGAWKDMWGLWVSGNHQDHAYLPYLGDFAQTLAAGALAVSLLAIVGFLADRYSEDGPTDLVSFAFYWGFASALGYPLVTDIMAPWATVNAVAPLTIPAAVGVGALLRYRWNATAERDPVSTVTTVLICVLIFGYVAHASVGGVYQDPQSDGNELVQFAQPAGDFGPVMEQLAVAAPQHEGVDVVLYSDFFVQNANGSAPREPGCSKWFNALPLPWYFTAADAEADCVVNLGQLETRVEESQPPVVIVREEDADNASEVLPNYESRTYRLRSHGSETTFFVHRDYADDLPGYDSE